MEQDLASFEGVAVEPPNGRDFDLSDVVRTHLTVITLASENLEVLYDQLDEEQRRRMIHSICVSSRALNKLVHGGLLDC